LGERRKMPRVGEPAVCGEKSGIRTPIGSPPNVEKRDEREKRGERENQLFPSIGSTTKNG